MEKKAIIVGAGPAGLTAAYELLTRTDIKPIILEKSGDIGGISKTVNYKGNRIDIGGHRFFSKSDRVMNWWLNIMPLHPDAEDCINITYHNQSSEIKRQPITGSVNAKVDPENTMLVRNRLSRIYFLRKFFTYPIQLSLDTLTKLGLWTTMAILLSYVKAQLLPRKPERNLEDFMINRFGNVLYKLFFKDYTEKVWGVSCKEISAEWGAQRIKGISVSKAIRHALQSAKKNASRKDIRQKSTETSLIEQFLYPMYGPGQLWVEVARQIESMGGTILMHHDVNRIYTSEDNRNVTAISAINNITGEANYLEGDYFFSTMPVQELIRSLDGAVPADVKEVAAGLQYRDFITVGILLNKLSFQDKKTGEWKPLELKDTWIYIQENDVKVGRLQIFNNWSPYLVKDPDTVWIGMEFFCNSTDDFWKKADDDIKQLAISELEKIRLASSANVLDTTVLRMEKAYPAYFGAYQRFDVIREYVDRIENLFLVGRNGMHKYNNSDHSMLTAMTAVDNICNCIRDKANIWAINTEQEYHEETAEVRDSGKIPAHPTGELVGKATPGFGDFVFRQNRVAVLLTTLCLAMQFVVFKILYPFANFMPDSYSYIRTAISNANVNMWPVGYSKFLRVFSAFTHSDTVLVLFQFLFLQGAVLCFVFTLLYLLQPGRAVRNVMLTFYVLNPIFLYTSNYVSSDAVFAGLSVLWVVQLSWMVAKPNPFHIWTHGVLLMVLLSIRYSALFYPVISVLIILLSGYRLSQKLEGIGWSIILIGAFVWHTGNQYKSLTGERQFSPFGGWQLASNSLYMYAHTYSGNQGAIPMKFQKLDSIAKRHADSLRYAAKRPDSTLGIYYLWNEKAPLKRYMENTLEADTITSYFKEWATVGPLYAAYGKYLIEKFPLGYVRYFLLPNLKNYYIPPLEFLGVYNMERDTVDAVARAWFGYPANRVTGVAKDHKVAALNWHPVINTLVNVAFLLACIGFFAMKCLSSAGATFTRLLLLTLTIWLIHFLFSVFAAPVVLRYQVFIMAVCFPMAVLVVNLVIQMDKEAERIPEPE